MPQESPVSFYHQSSSWSQVTCKRRSIYMRRDYLTVFSSANTLFDMHQKNMQPSRIIVWPLVILSLLTLCFSRANSAPWCTACNSRTDCPPPRDCTYGIVKDYCGRDTCAKGPGHRCGDGNRNLRGICGEGLICSCNRCGGCSLKTLECFSVTCI